MQGYQVSCRREMAKTHPLERPPATPQTCLINYRPGLGSLFQRCNPVGQSLNRWTSKVVLLRSIMYLEGLQVGSLQVNRQDRQVARQEVSLQDNRRARQEVRQAARQEVRQEARPGCSLPIRTCLH